MLSFHFFSPYIFLRKILWHFCSDNSVTVEKIIGQKMFFSFARVLVGHSFFKRVKNYLLILWMGQSLQFVNETFFPHESLYNPYLLFSALWKCNREFFANLFLWKFLFGLKNFKFVSSFWNNLIQKLEAGSQNMPKTLIAERVLSCFFGVKAINVECLIREFLVLRMNRKKLKVWQNKSSSLSF